MTLKEGLNAYNFFFLKTEALSSVNKTIYLTETQKWNQNHSLSYVYWPISNLLNHKILL
jgi:hypothetical protein